MSKITNTEIQKKSDKDLGLELVRLGDEALKIRFDMSGTGGNKNYEARVIRKNVARVKTEIRKRELATNN